MAIHVLTRHCESFNILTDHIDPTRSPYADTVNDYVQRIRDFYWALGVKSAMWAWAAWSPPEFFETDKPVEYSLQLSADRIIAYIDEKSWSDYLYGKRFDYVYSREPAQYESTSVLIALPVKREEIKVWRRYTRTSTGHCEIQEEKRDLELQQHLERICGTKRCRCNDESQAPSP